MIAIKNAVVPPSCYFCPMTNDGLYLCKANNPYKMLEDDCEERRPDWCSLVNVPPHGRLIDADALIEDLKYDVELDAVALDSMETVGDERRKIQEDKDFKQNCIFRIENAPTIIPAKEGE